MAEIERMRNVWNMDFYALLSSICTPRKEEDLTPGKRFLFMASVGLNAETALNDIIEGGQTHEKTVGNAAGRADASGRMRRNGRNNRG
jgi:hypothetical protein